MGPCWHFTAGRIDARKVASFRKISPPSVSPMKKNLLLAADEMAELLQVSERQLRRLTADGVLPVEADGYDVFQTVKRYLRNLKHDTEGPESRAALARQETRRKMAQTAQMTREL